MTTLNVTLSTQWAVISTVILYYDISSTVLGKVLEEEDAEAQKIQVHWALSLYVTDPHICLNKTQLVK